jgi:hypothetical protein
MTSRPRGLRWLAVEYLLKMENVGFHWRRRERLNEFRGVARCAISTVDLEDERLAIGEVAIESALPHSGLLVDHA